ncbi:malonate decarboxylase gamma subunit [Terrimicrobium sacchariphilum]|jgi:malonate decarboxylase gamma subunit|uniref:Malonate decarboxylase gamma subunit n=1 Tax=Terrimicrobium sacchariphilum TaxID=690879 RepID=A0A146G9V7_TERSA|nr:biotin-independent malonate decarboxylase subunit gamma [Terrimicrobium sacchariphilum]GAT33607.1 malonate decarboxylase gamma subunit [Terrimicrobium sacchariphilum]
MELPILLDQLFPEGHRVAAEDWLVSGEATLGGRPVAVLGTTNHVFIGIRESIALSGKLLDIVERSPGMPIIMLVDNNGQRMALDEELLVLPEYIAHLLRAQQLARNNGHKLIAVVYGNSIAGGFIAFGMLADRIVSVPGAETSVMKLEAIARVTKMPLEKLQDLARQVSVFAPGCENFFRMGGLHEMWADDFSSRLQKVLESDDAQDNRAILGKERGGRNVALAVIEEVRG